MINEGWSFCIVTSAGNDKLLKKSIGSIISEFSCENNFEIIVIGESGLKSEFLSHPIYFYEINERFFKIDFSLSNIRMIVKSKDFKRLIFKYGPISYKKNFAAKQSRFNKLCILHDYVALEPGWRDGFNKFDDGWDACMNVVLNKNGSRYRDWCTWDYPEVGPALLPYNKYVKEMYFSGTYFCVKREFFLSNMLDESLFWGEGEDVEWSIRVRNKTNFQMNVNSKVKFLKLKPLNSSPYDEHWKNNSKKLSDILDNKSI